MDFSNNVECLEKWKTINEPQAPDQMKILTPRQLEWIKLKKYGCTQGILKQTTFL